MPGWVRSKFINSSYPLWTADMGGQSKKITSSLEMPAWSRAAQCSGVWHPAKRSEMSAVTRGAKVFVNKAIILRLTTGSGIQKCPESNPYGVGRDVGPVEDAAKNQ